MPLQSEHCFKSRFVVLTVIVVDEWWLCCDIRIYDVTKVNRGNYVKTPDILSELIYGSYAIMWTVHANATTHNLSDINKYSNGKKIDYRLYFSYKTLNQCYNYKLVNGLNVIMQDNVTKSAISYLIASLPSLLSYSHLKKSNIFYAIITESPLYCSSSDYMTVLYIRQLSQDSPGLYPEM